MISSQSLQRDQKSVSENNGLEQKLGGGLITHPFWGDWPHLVGMKIGGSAQRYDNLKLIWNTWQATTMSWQNWTWHIFAKFKNPATLLSSSLPVSPSRVLRANGTPLYAIWYRNNFGPRGPGLSSLTFLACSPNGTDKRRQRQRRTKRPPPEPGNILKRFYALNDNSYYMRTVSKLYCALAYIAYCHQLITRNFIKNCKFLYAI